MINHQLSSKHTSSTQKKLQRFMFFSEYEGFKFLSNLFRFFIITLKRQTIYNFVLIFNHYFSVAKIVIHDFLVLVYILE